MSRDATASIARGESGGKIVCRRIWPQEVVSLEDRRVSVDAPNRTEGIQGRQQR